MMHEKMMKMLEKKGKKKLGDHEKAAKMSVLKELKDAMAEEMGGGLKDALAAKKVSVMAANKEDLKKGLDVAKKAVSGMSDGESSSEEAEESPMHEAAESAEEERAEHEEGAESDEADVEAEIAALEAKLAKLKSKKGKSEDEEEESDDSMEA